MTTKSEPTADGDQAVAEAADALVYAARRVDMTKLFAPKPMSDVVLDAWTAEFPALSPDLWKRALELAACRLDEEAGK